MKMIIFAIFALMSVAVQASPVKHYRCHSPANLDAAWAVDVKVAGPVVSARLMDPEVNGSSSPRGPAVTLQRAAAVVVNASEYEAYINQTGTFSVVIFNSITGVTNVEGRLVRGFLSELSGSLPGNPSARFKNMRVICESKERGPR